MKKTVLVSSIWIVVIMLFTVPLQAEAKSAVVAIEGVSYDVNASLKDNLKSLAGKKIYVTLDSGKTMIGIVKDAGEHLLHLEKLDGKDFFDALILIEDISAIDARFREYAR